MRDAESIQLRNRVGFIDSDNPLSVNLEGWEESGFIATPIPTYSGFNIPTYDDIDITYVASGNGMGEIETVIFKYLTNTIATLTLSYNSDDKLTDVTQT